MPDDKPAPPDDLPQRFEWLLNEFEKLKKYIELRFLHTRIYPQIMGPASGTSFPNGSMLLISVQSNRWTFTLEVRLRLEGSTSDAVAPVDVTPPLVPNGPGQAQLVLPTTPGSYVLVCRVKTNPTGNEQHSVAVTVT